MKKIEIISSVENGNLKRNRNTIKEAIKTFEGKEILLTIQRKRKQRSNNQNQYYWGVILECWRHLIKTEWGEIWSKESTHEFLKMNFNYNEKYSEETGELLRTPKSTTENSTSEMEDFHTVCRQKANEFFNYEIPLPNEEIKLEL